MHQKIQLLLVLILVQHTESGLSTLHSWRGLQLQRSDEENDNNNTKSSLSSSSAAAAAALRDEQTWKAIYQFAINCQKRHAYEKEIIQNQNQQQKVLSKKSKNDDDIDSDTNTDSPIVLPTRVPEDTEI